jgi:hypothetical protein
MVMHQGLGPPCRAGPFRCVVANPCKKNVKCRDFQARWTGCQIWYSRCTFIMWGQWGADDHRRMKPPSTLSRHGRLVPDHCPLFWIASNVCRHPVKRRHIESCEPCSLNVVRLDRGDVIGKRSGTATGGISILARKNAAWRNFLRAAPGARNYFEGIAS